MQATVSTDHYRRFNEKEGIPNTEKVGTNDLKSKNRFSELKKTRHIFVKYKDKNNVINEHCGEESL